MVGYLQSTDNGELSGWVTDATKAIYLYKIHSGYTA